jgi:HK97 family phage portal protein
MGFFKDLWYNIKMNPAQASIAEDEGERKEATYAPLYFGRAYDTVEVVRRGVDMIVDSAAEINVSMGDKLPFQPQTTIGEGPNRKPGLVRAKKLGTLLNFQPNEDDDMNTFRRQIYMDLVLDGNAFIYFDGAYLYHLPAHLMEILTGKKTKVKGYIYDSKTEFKPNEIIHIRENAGDSIYRGVSRLKCTKRSIDVLYKMLRFQELFFENGAVPGLVLTTPNILSAKIKQRILENWRRSYSPRSGARRPILLDGDFKVHPLSDIKWKELDFENSVDGHELKILKALGVPPVLLNSGNNANLSPNLRLFYEETVLPLVTKVISAMERYFAYDLEPDTIGVRALQPEIREQTSKFVGLVNAGIITVNEARFEMRMSPSTETHADELRIPANIAGSAVNPNEGGRPSGDTEEEEETTNEE